MEDKKSEIIQICGLWQNETKDGASKFLKGNSGQVQYLVFRNKNKTQANHPDYHLCITKNNTQKKENSESEVLRGRNPKLGILPDNPTTTNKQDYQEPESYDFDDQDIPF